MINAIRAHLAEFGVTAAVGRKGIEELLRVIADPSDENGCPMLLRACLAALGGQLLSLKKQILDFDQDASPWRSTAPIKRASALIASQASSPLLATALVASVADPKTFRSGRNFSAWIGRWFPNSPRAAVGNEARQYQQTGGSLSAQPVRGRCTRRHSLCQIRGAPSIGPGSQRC